MKQFDNYIYHPGYEINQLIYSEIPQAALQAMLRDILAELEQLGKRMDDLENEELGFPPAITAIQEMCMALQDVIHATASRMDARLAKLEQIDQPVSIDQQIAMLQSEIPTLDRLIELTPKEDVIDLHRLKSRKMIVQEEIVKLEENSSYEKD